MRADAATLLDILDSIRQIQAYVRGLDRQGFETNRLVQDAVIRQIEIMGEAAKRLSAAFRDSNPQIPWREIAGMRDVLIHQYDEVDLDQVWHVVSVEIAPLLQAIEPLTSP